MSKQYDSTSKELIELGAVDWLAFLGAPRPAEKVRILNVDLSTVVAEADRALLVDDPTPWILHLEFQSSWEGELVRRVLRYNGLLQDRHHCDVSSVIVLLRPEANSPSFTGEKVIQTGLPNGWTFRYHVIKIWEIEPAAILRHGLWLLQLLPISNTKEVELPSLMLELHQRIRTLRDSGLRGKFWTATGILMGLKYQEAFIDQLLHGVMDMEESTYYQAIMRRGLQRGEHQVRLSEARALLLRQGRVKFGIVPANVEATINSLGDLSKLEGLFEKVLFATDWDSLLSEL
jgi:hypothetical protein